MMHRRTFCALCSQAAIIAHSTGSITALSALAQDQNRVLTIDDPGCLGRTQAPMFWPIPLHDQFLHRLGQENRLLIQETTPNSTDSHTENPNFIPVQWCVNLTNSSLNGLYWIMPPGNPGRRRFEIVSADKPATNLLKVKRDPSGQFDLFENQQKILRYNYATIQPGQLFEKIAPGNRIYAVARSNYIHPLFGPHGEELTKDWSIDHPHHRGIYWAWPEVDWQDKRGDLHALQKVFARPTGIYQEFSGPVFAQIVAENMWQWENQQTIALETSIIRAWKATPHGRMIDLIFRFAAIDQPVLLARRDTRAYGGLNLRFSQIQNQRISKHIDPPIQVDSPLDKASPAWAEISGIFSGARSPSGVLILQHAGNPDYPGNWVDYPELNWLQPTFPASGTRFVLHPGKPLTLKFRLWIHSGEALSDKEAAEQWLAMHQKNSPLG